jgi:putative intracellular protease/amidase
MGASYSTDIAKKVKEASTQELKDTLESMSEADRNKLSEALKKKALIVCTSSAKLGEKETGVWSEECTGPYYIFKDAGYLVTVCSIFGGDVPVDAGSLSGDFKTENDKRMEKDDAELFKKTPKLEDQDLSSFDIILFSGGHGTCVDFPTVIVGDLVSKALLLGKVVGAVCHGPMALVNAKTEAGESILKGKKIACFTNAEEDQVGLSKVVPFLLEDKLKELGAIIESASPWSDNAVRDGKLVTGQNPQSSVSVAKLCLEALKAPILGGA